VSKQLKFKGMW